MRNRSNAMIPIQDLDIDARHTPLRRPTSIHHPLCPLTYLRACGLLIIPLANPDGSKTRLYLYSQYR